MDLEYEPPATETRSVYGINLRQHRNDARISPSDTFNTIITPKDSSALPESALRDLTVATIALKYTQVSERNNTSQDEKLSLFSQIAFAMLSMGKSLA